MKDWKTEIKKADGENTGIYLVDGAEYNVDEKKLINFIEQIISERDKECDKWKVLAQAMDNAPVGHRVIIKHLLGEDEWTLTRKNKI